MQVLGSCYRYRQCWQFLYLEYLVVKVLQSQLMSLQKLSMEMDKLRIDTAPSVAGMQAVMEVYRDPSIIANKVATYLCSRRFSCWGWSRRLLPGARRDL